MAGGSRSGSAGPVLEAEGSGREAGVDVAAGRPWSESVSASGSSVPGSGAGVGTSGAEVRQRIKTWSRSAYFSMKTSGC